MYLHNLYRLFCKWSYDNNSHTGMVLAAVVLAAAALAHCVVSKTNSDNYD